MRILHFYKIMNTGGAETFIMNVYRRIDRSKYKFDFLCSSNKKGFYDDEIKSLGGKILYYKISKNPFITIYRIVKVIKDGDYDAIHSPMMFFSSIICVAAKLSHVKKIIVHSHSASDIKKETFFRKIYIKMSRFLINKLSTDKIACGIDAANYLFGTNKNINICHNGIDFERFSTNFDKEIISFKKKYRIDNNTIIIGEVASFLPVKNHKYYINFAKKLIELNKQFVIILIGEGPLKESFKNEVISNNLSNHFIILNATNEIPFYMNLFDIYMMPSLYEGFPMSVIEAVSCGNHCILSDNITKETQVFGEYVESFSINSFPLFESFTRKKNINKDKIRALLLNNGFLIDSTVYKLEVVYGGKKNEKK